MAKGDVHVIIDPVIHEAALASKEETGRTLTQVVEDALFGFGCETPQGYAILDSARKIGWRLATVPIKPIGEGHENLR